MKTFHFLTLMTLSVFVTTITNAQGGLWDPPKGGDCGNPLVFCADSEPAWPGDAWGGAATAVGEAIEKQAEEDPIKKIIKWFADTFGPKIPGAPKDDGGGKDGGKDGGNNGNPGKDNPDNGNPDKDKPDNGDKGGDEAKSRGDSKTNVFITGAKFNKNVRNFFNRIAEGKPIKIGNNSDKQQAKYTLISRREVHKSRPHEYRIVVLVKYRSKKGKMKEKPLYIMGRRNQVHFFSKKA